MPQNWKTYKLGEVLKVKHGYAFKGKHFTTDPNDNLLLTPGNFEPQGGVKFNWGKQKFYKGEFPEEYICTEGDLLVAMTDLTQSCIILGSPLVIKDNKYNYLHNQRLGLIQEDESKADRLFLYYYFNSYPYRQRLIATKSGSTVSHTAPERIYDCDIYLPPLPEQKAIASILSAIDDKIENNLAMNKTLEEMAMALYKHWFVDFGPFQDQEFIDSELGSIPKGWEVKALTEISINHNRKRKPISTRERAKIQGVYPYYGATKALDFINAYKFDGEFILLAEDGTVKTKRDTPFLQFVEGKFWVSNHAHVLTGNDTYSNEFLYLSLSNTNVIPIITGAVQLKISKTNLETLSFIAPTSGQLESFEEQIIPWFKTIKSNLREVETLSKLRDTLLPKLISGEVRIKDVEQTVANAL